MGRKPNPDNQEATLLKKEIRQLKKEIGRLSKELARCGQLEADYLESLDIEESADSILCGGCSKGGLIEFITPAGSVRYFCKECKWRGAA